MHLEIDVRVRGVLRGPLGLAAVRTSHASKARSEAKTATSQALALEA